MKKIIIAFQLLLLAIIPISSLAKGRIAINDPAPNFKLINVDGKYYSLDDYKDKKGVILVFTCNVCPFAVKYEQRIIDLHKQFAPQGYPVVAINPNDPSIVPGDSYQEMVKRAKEKAYPFVYLFDAKQEVFPKYGASRTPEIFLIKNEKEKSHVVYIGAIDDNHSKPEKAKKKYVAQAIHELEQGKKPSVKTTKAIGCSIKYKK